MCGWVDVRMGGCADFLMGDGFGWRWALFWCSGRMVIGTVWDEWWTLFWCGVFIVFFEIEVEVENYYLLDGMKW